MNPDLEEIRSVLRTADVLYDRDQVVVAIDRLAAEITHELQDKAPLVLCVMNGGLVFSGQLLPRLEFPLELGYLHASRYAGAIEGGVLKWIQQPTFNLKDRTVLILDDIFDEGYTLKAIADWCQVAGAVGVYTAVLLNKLHARKVSAFTPNFAGLDCPDRYVFGYGMDYKGFWRNAPGVYAVKGL